MNKLATALREARLRKGLKQGDVARLVGRTKNVVSNWERGENKPDLDTVELLCRELHIDPSQVIDTGRAAFAPTMAECAWLERYRRLDTYGRAALDALLAVESTRIERETAAIAVKVPTMRVIKRFLVSATTAPGSHIFDGGYQEVEVPADAEGDFLVRITGDSMEPYICDGQDVYVNIGADIHDGDVGIFFYEGSTYCKQYCEAFGFIYLFSLNRARANADLAINTKTGPRVECYGKVLLAKQPPLPS